MKAPLILGVCAAAVLTIAGCSSTPESGTETLAGTTSSTAQHPTIHLKASGLFADTGTIKLSGNGGAGTGVIHLGKGNITVHHAKGSNGAPPRVNSKCAASFSSKGAYKFLSGTGTYKGITGGGVYKVTFSGTLPRKSNGKCNLSRHASPVKGTARTAFHATGQAKL